MSNPLELGGLLYEREAEKAFAREAEIEQAAIWCKANYPHKFNFLNEMYLLLVEEERSFRRMGLTAALKTGAVKLQPVLAILTPSQALRLLESFKRATLNDPKVWRSKKITDIEKVESDIRRDKLVAEIKEAIKRKHNERIPPGESG